MKSLCSSVRRLATVFRGTLVLVSVALALVMSQTVAVAGNDPNYYWDEAKNPGGSNKCTNNNQCDGRRTCSANGWCQGVSRTAKEAHWEYEPGMKGPAKWGVMAREFVACDGKQQSPIDISTKTTEKGKAPALGFSYKAGTGSLINNGHTVEVELTDGGSAKLTGGDYQLIRFHFHTPSEEAIDGSDFPMVAHLVHQNTAKNLAVVAVLFREGSENAALKPVFDALPAKKDGKAELKAKLNPADFLPANKAYYAYRGSLTTPPCSEQVSWHVMKNPVELSKAQIQAFRNLYKINARPRQPLNGRTVQESN